MTRERILVIEDDPDIVRIVRAYLERDGFQVEVAHDGVSGFARALDAPPALVLLDWMLPGLDGLQLLARLREESDLPVVMLTARGEADDRLEGFAYGADDYIPKPFHPPELVARVKAVLRRSRAGEPGGPLVRGDLTVDPVKRTAVRAG